MENMVNRFAITLACITPIQYPNLPFSQIVDCQAFSQLEMLYIVTLEMFKMPKELIIG